MSVVRRRKNGLRPVLLTWAALASTGCAPPNAANIALRKQVRTQQDEIDRLTRRLTAATAPTTAAHAATRTAAGPTLTPEQTETLVTVHGIRLGRLTRIDDNVLSVHLVPTDVDDEPLKAAGAITIEAFDLADAGRPIGRWAFDARETRRLWHGTALRYEYVLPCPLGERPTREVTVRVTFVDALTGRSFPEQVTVTPPSGG